MSLNSINLNIFMEKCEKNLAAVRRKLNFGLTSDNHRGISINVANLSIILTHKECVC